MSKPQFNAPHFQSPEAAREYLEALRWGSDRVCRHCGTGERGRSPPSLASIAAALRAAARKERLDATMDKAIRRLAQAKTLKQVSGLNRPRPSKPALLQIDTEDFDEPKVE